MKDIIKVKGMSCASCAATVEKTLKNVDGVSNATVNLVANNASVEYDDEKTNLKDLQQAINKSGFEAGDKEESTLSFEVSNMSCASCVASIEKELKKQLGISQVNVNLITKQVNVTYDSELISPNKIVEAVSNIGYEVKNLDKV